MVFLDTPVSRVWLHSAGIQLYEDEIDMNKEVKKFYHKVR